jgi:hypothetical protein
MWHFAKPKPTPPRVIIRNVLGEEIDRADGVWHLENADLRHRQWAHADLTGMSLDGANCEGIFLFGCRKALHDRSTIARHSSVQIVRSGSRVRLFPTAASRNASR